MKTAAPARPAYDKAAAARRALRYAQADLDRLAARARRGRPAAR
jgi:hypothetical protein